MSKPVMVPITECPIGETIHEPHEWRQGFFLIKHGCIGYSERYRDMDEVLRLGSMGLLTDAQAEAYLKKWGRA